MNESTFNQMVQQTKDNITAKVIADSINPYDTRLTTMEWKYPRFIHSEIMTHRKLSKNSASSRAIPLKRMIQNISDCPVFPIHWGKNQPGMQADEELGIDGKMKAADEWMIQCHQALKTAQHMEDIGVHKQLANRLIEPWMWITVIVSATNFENLFALRCHKAAEPHFQHLAYKVRAVLDKSKPRRLEWGMWHLPYFSANGGSAEDLQFLADERERLMLELDEVDHLAARVSAGRCARVSYLTHEGKRDCEADVQLYSRLAGSSPIHASPLEHPAMAVCPDNGIPKPPPGFPKFFWKKDWGNFDPGWFQFRKMHDGENVTSRV